MTIFCLALTMSYLCKTICFLLWTLKARLFRGKSFDRLILNVVQLNLFLRGLDLLKVFFAAQFFVALNLVKLTSVTINAKGDSKAHADWTCCVSITIRFPLALSAIDCACTSRRTTCICIQSKEKKVANFETIVFVFTDL